MDLTTMIWEIDDAGELVRLRSRAELATRDLKLDDAIACLGDPRDVSPIEIGASGAGGEASYYPLTLD